MLPSLLYNYIRYSCYIYVSIICMDRLVCIYVWIYICIYKKEKTYSHRKLNISTASKPFAFLQSGGMPASKQPQMQSFLFGVMHIGIASVLWPSVINFSVSALLQNIFGVPEFQRIWRTFIFWWVLATKSSQKYMKSICYLKRQCIFHLTYCTLKIVPRYTNK